MSRSLAVAFLLMFTVAANAADPSKTDGDKYKVRFENDRVRVLEYTDKPGEKTHQHDHPAFLSSMRSARFRRKLALPDGKRADA